MLEAMKYLRDEFKTMQRASEVGVDQTPIQIQCLELVNKMTCPPVIQILNIQTFGHPSNQMNLWTRMCMVLLSFQGTDRVFNLSRALIRVTQISFLTNLGNPISCVRLSPKSTRIKENIKLWQNTSLSHLLQRNQSSLFKLRSLHPKWAPALQEQHKIHTDPVFHW